MYCSCHYSDGTHICPYDERTRVGYKEQFYQLEELFYRQGVDLQVYGHQHNYERSYPVFDYQVQRVGDPSVYRDVKYPVHVVSGTAGNREIHYPYNYPQPHWSFLRLAEYGIGNIQVLDPLSIQFKQYSIDAAQFIDTFVMSKSQPYPVFYNPN